MQSFTKRLLDLFETVGSLLGNSKKADLTMDPSPSLGYKKRTGGRFPLVGIP